MVRLSLVAAIFVCFLFVNDGLAQSDRRQSWRDKQRRRLDELSRATSWFGVNLFRRLASSSDDNLIFSPLSVYTALSMTLLGTHGDTKRQLKVIPGSTILLVIFHGDVVILIFRGHCEVGQHWTLTFGAGTVLSFRRGQGVHRALHAIFASFPTSPDANVTLRVANAAYYDAAQVTLADRFLRDVRRSYGASPRPFQRPEPETAINEWVSCATGGMIPDFLDAGAITPDTVLMLLNAVYFQGTWEEIFDERATREANFTTFGGATVRVPMMNLDSQFSVKDVAELEARVLELPYREGRFSLFVILPNAVDGLRDVEGRLTSQVLEEALSNMPQRYRYDVSIPKFKMSTKKTLNDILKSLGLTLLFDRQNADLSRMVSDSTSGMNLYVDKVQHEAVIEVNERGTKAAAVTSVGVSVVSLPPQFRANHPFLVVLRDKTAKMNIFMGRLNDPSSSSQ
ncbi:hypothetical protein BaRGS_00019419 [Batillaria attramentaria]|uniref:Serpin domain-containing protein n=1 Tax=Batillaria attramentaria TaxID=370345 RepID=A0ABD0KPW9_9CAEN